MNRENRINLWFLGVFLAVSLPGVVMLVRKRMHGGGPPPLMYPDAMSHRLAYMTPLPAPPDATWLVPPLTRAWVDELVHTRCGARGAIFGTDLRGDPVPVLSDDRVAQVVWRDDVARSPKTAILLWQETGEPVDAAGISVTTGASAEVQRPSLVNCVTVPQAVRQELMSCGYLRPPHAVLWMECALPADTRVVIHQKQGDTQIDHSIEMTSR